ncbi:MAG: SLC13 family permease [Desulfobacterales bacterium]
MTLEILMVLSILLVSVIFLVTEWIPMEVTALLVLGIVALTGLVTPVESLSGFSNPAVVTIWAVFILSGGLTRTGVANIIGNFVMKLAGNREINMIVVIMTTSGIMSAVMNNVAVAALMLPVVMDIARHTGSAPSRLLMPLAYGTLLGGLTTQIGTPPNILVTDALRESGFKPFTFFDFTPVGLVVMFVGIAFMVLIGRHLLPKRDVAKESTAGRKVDWQSQYSIHERIFHISVPSESILISKTLGQIRMGSILGWNVIGITRGNHSLMAPGPNDGLQEGDSLTVEGRIENLDELKNWRQMKVEEGKFDIRKLYPDNIKFGEVLIPQNSPFVGSTLYSLDFRNRFKANVLAIRHNDHVQRIGLQDQPLFGGAKLLLAASEEHLGAFENTTGFDRFRYVTISELATVYRLHEQMIFMQVPEDSGLVGKSLKESRLADAFGSHVLGILRDKGSVFMPEPGEILQAEDRLVVEGRLVDFELLQGLEDLVVDQQAEPSDISSLVSEDTGLMEAILAPGTVLEGKTLRQLNFREKYGLNVLALWRAGHAHRSDLRNMDIRFGDALLLLGPRNKLQMLGSEPDFIVLTQKVQEKLRWEKMKISILIMFGVLFPVFIGWVPIYIAGVVGAALMVLTGCLTMEEAYRQIEWKAVFLIAGMLPLGTALDQTGAAKMIAESVVAVVGPYGPNAVMFGLISLTFLATCFVPTAALVVLMAPIALSTSANMGLSPYGLMMAISMAASASFTTPISHPANILVMGPGGYRFLDYVKVGGLLTLVTLVVLMLIMPILWPLVP